MGGGANARPPNYLKSVEVVNRSTKRTGVTGEEQHSAQASTSAPRACCLLTSTCAPLA